MCWMAWLTSLNHYSPAKEGRKHVQIFLPDLFLTLTLGVTLRLDETEMEFVAKLHWKIYLRAVPFHISMQGQFVPLTLGKSLSGANQGSGFVPSRAWVFRKTGHGLPVTAKCVGIPHFSLTFSWAWGPIKWRVLNESIFEVKSQDVIVSKCDALPDPLG